jgi:hypothetical protein
MDARETRNTEGMSDESWLIQDATKPQVCWYPSGEIQRLRFRHPATVWQDALGTPSATLGARPGKTLEGGRTHGASAYGHP